ncbi:MAG: hypothetical protein QOH89_3083 [Pseudonocardiales bacterium]|nr:hypothetical protein [Pseudonocardiales bacterium]
MSGAIKERRITVAELVPGLRSGSVLVGWLLATVIGYGALIFCAAVPTEVGTVLAAAAVAGCEAFGVRGDQFLGWTLRRVSLGVLARGLLRGVALLLFAARSNSAAVTIGVAAAVVGLAAVRALHHGAIQVVEFLRTPLITSRNLDLDLPPVPGVPPRWLTRPDRWTALVEVIIAVTLALSADGDAGIAVAGLVVAAVMASSGPAALGLHALRLRRLRVRPRASAAVLERLAALRPEIVAYLGNGAEWRYQLEMWLRALESVRRPVVLIVREHDVLRTLAPTSLPVVCIPGGTTLMELELPALRAALYVGNTANNIHLLRRPRVRTVFIGHGDSDKGASANPFSRVYEEIWVAGPAGRDRYAAGGVNIAPSAFVEIGRPQLGDLARVADSVPRVTVLYAPTFEGFGEDPYQTSLPYVGVEIVRTLLARDDVRVMYRPHPRTGHRDAATRRAHLEIIRMLRKAGAPAPGTPRLGPPPSATPARRGDLLDEMLAPIELWSAAAHESAVGRWNATYWGANPGHRILMSPAPDLHACFTVADALIADISSVTSDFLAANRPYAVVNCTGASDEQFRLSSPTATGGFVLREDLGALDALVLAASGGEDPSAAAREEARRYVLGPTAGDPTARFRAELDRLCATAPAPRSATAGQPGAALRAPIDP